MKAFFTILVLIFTIPLCSQDFSCQKSIYVEIGGSAGVGSINYESIFAATGKTEFLWRFGLSGLPIDKNNGFVIIIPATVGTLIGGNNINLNWVSVRIQHNNKGKSFCFNNPNYWISLSKNPANRFIFELHIPL
ncbi:MAG: hypothetical protein R2751_02745 [Bacteroidales bacterium]